MGIYVKLVNELYTRITSAQATGKKLATVKKVFVEAREFLIMGETTPYIIIALDNFHEKYEGGQQRHKNADIKITVKLIYQIFEQDNNNLLYKLGTPNTGYLDLVEKILDVINETTAQVIDPRLNQTSHTAMQIDVNFDKTNDGFFCCSIDLLLTSINFTINGRN